MTDPTGPPPRPPLDAYLDNVLDGAERARVEREIAGDASASAEVRLQHEIDGSLRRLFDMDAAPASIPIGAGRSRRPWYLGIAAAAAVVISGAALYTASVLSAPRPDVGIIYLTEVSTGFKPQEVCTTPEAFAGWVKERYGEPLYPTGSLEGIRFVGWSYANAISGYTGVLLAEVDQRRVVVVLDKVSREERRPSEPADASLHMFRSRIGDLVLYELSPLPKPRILPVLSDKAAPAPRG